MNLSRKHVNRKWTGIFFVVSLFLLMAVSPSYAIFGGKIDSFSADNVEIDPNGKVTNTSKFYMTPDRMRIDGMPGQGGQGMPKMNLSMLILKKQNKQYFYNHDKKLVFESPVDEENLQPGYKAMDNLESEKILGKENVSGYSCVKKEVVTSFTMMGMTHKSTLVVWESDKFDMPLKTLDEDGAVQEMRNIKTGAPSKDVFKPLKGYTKVGNMMAVMGMDFAAMARQDDLRNTQEPGEENENMDENMDVQAMMAKMNQAMGENMEPGEKEQMMQIMAQAMGQINQTKQGKGAATDLWKTIPMRSGDKVGYEMKIGNILDVILGSQSSLEQVFQFYREKLKAKGWKDGGTYIQDGQGTMSMSKGDQSVMIAWADNPGMDGNYKLFYNIHYTGIVK